MPLLSALLFCGGLLYAAVDDIRTRTVDDRVCLCIAAAGLFSLGAASLPGALLGALPFYIGAGFGKNGAGDVFLAAACGFVLKPYRTMLGLGLFCVFYGLYIGGWTAAAKIRCRPAPQSCPLAPFLAAGFIPAYFIC